MSNLKKKSQIFKPFHIAALQILKKALAAPAPWLDALTQSWNADALILDEAQVQAGRAELADRVIPDLIAKGTKVYVIKTGHHVYKDLLPTGAAPPRYRPNGAQYYLESGVIDEQVARAFYPQENIVRLGNLRMDRNWIVKLRSDILSDPYYPAQKHKNALPQSGLKIVMMLAKMNYGVEADALKDLIRTLGNMEGVSLVLKPHTRGMKFDFMPKEEIGRAAIADQTPSAILCEWCDVLLFTGSSIAFHAMVLNKSVGYLKFCQRLETIFDEDEGVDMYDDPAALKELIRTHAKAGTKPAPHLKAHELLLKHVYAGHEHGQTAAIYRDTILQDLNKSE